VAAKKIDLSHNLISQIKNLQMCIKLESLDVSFNRIADLTNIRQMVGGIKILNLRHNNISDTTGLDKLYSLEKLDLSHNTIGALKDIERLNSLPLLRFLWLENNPVTLIDGYRIMTLSFFCEHVGEVSDCSMLNS
jgi:Leucine-rich repeat (LRR) protein